MSTIQALDELLSGFPEDRVREVLDFARYLQIRSEQEQWRLFGAEQFGRGYGPDEPNYSLADIKGQSKP